MAENAHIFLSYRSIEADFALKLAADLKNAGVRLWMDRLDGIQVGMDWRDAIREALNACAALIAVLSPDYVEAEYCKKELAHADSLQRPIFPVLLRPVKKEDVPLALAGVQHEDFTNWRDEKEYARRLEKLIARLRSGAARQVGAIPDAETRYLTSLIADLEAARGVLQYVALSGEMDRERPPDVRPKPVPEDEWGFAELVQSRPKSSSDSALPPRPDRRGVLQYAPTELERGEGTREERIPLKNIAEAVDKHPRFVLIGDPGAGKTTTIRRLALDMARARLDNPHTVPIPLLLYLPQWDQEPTPAEFVRSRWERWGLGGDVAGMVHCGDVRLYLDGLNEMGANGPRRTKQLSAWFAGEDAPAHAIVTCRAGDYAGDLRLGETPTVLAQELDEAQIRQFAANYLKETAGAFLAQVLPKNEWERESARSLARLARNPYMLSALLFIYEQGGDLPRNTGALFYGLIRALWKREELRGTTGGIPFEQAERAFARLAFAMIDKDKPLDVPVEWALEQMGIEASDLLRIGISANYVVVSSGQVRFYHQLMQETFAALELGRVGLVGRIKSPKFNGWDGTRIAQRWDQVVIALCGVRDDEERVVEAVIRAVSEVDPFLAEDCVASGVKVGAIQQVVLVRLAEKLRDAEQWVRQAAVEALGKRGWVPGDDDTGAYYWIAQMNWDQCVRLGSVAVEPLITALHVDALWVRSGAAGALGRIGDPYAVDPLFASLHDADWRVRCAAANALGQIDNPRAVKPLIAALRDSDNNVRRVAVSALGQIGNPRAVKPLIAVLRNSECRVQQAAVEALGQIGDPRAVKTLITILRDTNWEVRRAPWAVRRGAADALGRIGDSAVKPLIAALRDANWEVRQAAADALGRIGNPRAVEPLIAALRDANWEVRQAAADALGRIDTPRVVEPLIAALHDADWKVQRTVVDALGRIGDSAVRSLIAALHDTKWDVRKAVANALIQIGSSAVEPLTAALCDADDGVRWIIASALGEISDSRAIEPLIASLDDMDRDVQIAAVGALEKIGTPEARAVVEAWRREHLDR